MTPLQCELQHLLNLMAEPYRESWVDYCKAKARGLAKKYPEDYAGLPEALAAAMTSEPSSEKPSEQQGTA